jgi:DmsE family decaheme c-type cytochrome
MRVLGIVSALFVASMLVTTTAAAQEKGGVRFYGPDELDKAPAAQSAQQMAPATMAPNMASGEYDGRGARACLRCHDESSDNPVLAVLNTPHAVKGDARTPFAKNDCETCHGPGAQHMESPGPGMQRNPIAIGFGPKQNAEASVQNEICMQCHQGDERQHWAGSAHDSSDVACSGCHTIHAVRDPVKQRTEQAGVCFKCHATQRAQSFMPSRHDVRGGQVICSECHQPHGSASNALLAEANVLETCYSCHAERRGPFLHEHPPVRDNCMNCHNPHGSVNYSLLNVRPPHLCQQCHSGTSHRAAAFSGEDIASDNQGALQRMMVRGCANCHSQIHGSNHPAGVKFQR